jgi:hypothetical protein
VSTNRIGCYPGSFNPPTVAHLAVAEAAWRQCGLDRVDLVVSRVALGKPAPEGPDVDARVAVLAEVARTRPWLGVRVSAAQLLVDVAAGYDLLVVGADKWAQVVDAAWYDGSVDARDDALARLPEVVVAPRPPWPLPSGRVLALDAAHGRVSATGARTAEPAWMLPEARASGLW